MLSAGRSKSMGSDQTSLPCAMVTEAEPEKASALSVVVSMVLSTRPAALHKAMWAEEMVTDPLPAELES